MNVKKYKNLKEALLAIIIPDKEFRILNHKLLKGEKIRKHYHPNAKEFVIFDRGRIRFFFGDKWKELEAKKKFWQSLFLQKLFMR